MIALLIVVSEHLNVLIFELSKSYHNAMSKVDTSAYIPCEGGE